MNEQIKKYFQGELTSYERLELLRAVKENESLKKDFIQLQNLHALFSITPQKDDEKAGISFYKKFRHYKKKRIIRKTILRYASYAAVIICMLTGSWFGSYYYNESLSSVNPNKLYVPSGQRACVTLNDGTDVWLNAGSTLLYPAEFKGKERRVTLIGEAFFDIAKDRDKPFIVSTKGIDIKAVGTKFNVYCSPKTNYVCASLIEGSILVYEPEKETQNIRLNPNEQVYYQNGVMRVQKIKNPSDFLWKDGIYNFENEPFGDIAKRLELYYDINIIVSDTSLEAREYTGKFRQLDGVDEILRIIQKIHKFKIKKEPEKNTIIISR